MSAVPALFPGLSNKNLGTKSLWNLPLRALSATIQEMWVCLLLEVNFPCRLQNTSATAPLHSLDESFSGEWDLNKSYCLQLCSERCPPHTCNLKSPSRTKLLAVTIPTAQVQTKLSYHWTHQLCTLQHSSHEPALIYLQQLHNGSFTYFLG